MRELSRKKNPLLQENDLLKKKIEQLEIAAAELKMQNDRLRKSEEKYRVLLAESPDPTFSFTPEGQYIYVNKAFAEGVGKPLEEIIGRRIWDVFSPDEANRRFAALSEVFRTGEEKVIEVRVPRSDGDRYYVTTITPVKDPQGEILFVLCSSKNITDHKKAQTALQESEERYRTLVENARDIVFGTDSKGHFTYVNQAVLHYLGYQENDIIGKHYSAFIRPDRREQVSRFFGRQFVKLIQNTYAEYPVVSNDGREFWIGQNTRLIVAEGQVRGFQAVARDITDRKQAEEALRESEERFRSVVEKSLIGIAIIDDEFHYTYVNEEFCNIAGYDKQEIIDRDFTFLLAEESRLFVIDVNRRRQRGENVPTQYEFSFIRKNGEKRIGEVRSALYRDSAGKVKVIIQVIDITERKRTDDALRKSEELYTSLVNAIPDFVIRTDLDGKILFVNDYTLQISGYRRDEVVGANMLRFIDETDRAQVMEKVQQLIRNGLEPQEYRLLMKDGRKIPFEINSDVLHNVDGTPFGLVNVCRNITERRQAEEEKRSLEERLNRAEKMEALGQLAGGVAHDLNNVLGVLSGYSELLLMDIPAGRRERDHVEKIFQSTEQGAAIIQDLLTLARRGVTVAEVINLNSIVRNFLKNPVLENMKEHHPQVNFRTVCQDELLNIKGSSIHLEKTLMNLVANAAESISGNGEVTIRTESRYLDKPVKGYDEIKEGDYTILSVTDTGMGISVENRKKIFEPFYTRKTMGRSGTGLGLAIVWGTVKDHHGYIDVQTAIGQGTTFTLYFPVTREELTTPQAKIPIEQYMGDGESVLIVDDIPEQRDVASRLLKRLGYNVKAVSGGEEAVAYLREHKADIIVLDMIMAPGIDGLETYQRIIKIHPLQKAILVSGFSETDRVRKAQKLGAGSYVKKPYVLEKIGLAIRRELNR